MVAPASIPVMLYSNVEPTMLFQVDIFYLN